MHLTRFAPACAPVLLLALTGCDLPTPMAPAEPIGEYPKWGEGFGVPTEAPASALGGGGAGGAGGTAATGGEAPKSPGDTGDWTGGDATLGKGVYVAMCARCHGDTGEGGAMTDGKPVAPLNDAAWQDKTTDRQMARVIVLGKDPMPGFMQELDRAKLSGVVAYIRTLKKK
ncbi:MAG: cytochrome c [Deltaproteobacteria bacterium]|nr:cytochrome c [Deltaproteobacteria bacterium]